MGALLRQYRPALSTGRSSPLGKSRVRFLAHSPHVEKWSLAEYRSLVFHAGRHEPELLEVTRQSLTGCHRLEHQRGSDGDSTAPLVKRPMIIFEDLRPPLSSYAPVRDIIMEDRYLNSTVRIHIWIILDTFVRQPAI